MENVVIGYARWDGTEGSLWTPGHIYEVYSTGPGRGCLVETKKSPVLFSKGCFTIADTREELETILKIKEGN